MVAAAIEVWGLGFGTKGAGMALRREERATGATGRVAGEEGSRRRRDCRRRRTWVEPRCEDSTRKSPTAQPAPHLVNTQLAPTPITVKIRSHSYQ